MSSKEQMIQEWILMNKERLIDCKFQPGNLLISKQSCIERQKRAKEEEDLADLSKGDYASYVFRRGLAICLECNDSRVKSSLSTSSRQKSSGSFSSGLRTK